MNNAHKLLKKETNSGFTLIELMVVIAIIGIVTGIAIKMYPRDEYKLKKVLRGISTDIQKTKMEAIKTNSNHGILFNPAGGYTIYSGAGDDEIWTGAGEADNPVVKIVNFGGHNTGVTWDTAVPQALGVVIPLDGISYNNNLLTLNSRGFCNLGYVYINFRNIRYAVGTPFRSGIIRLRRWDGAAWK